jgi:hypothetical protein
MISALPAKSAPKPSPMRSWYGWEGGGDKDGCQVIHVTYNTTTKQVLIALVGEIEQPEHAQMVAEALQAKARKAVRQPASAGAGRE